LIRALGVLCLALALGGCGDARERSPEPSGNGPLVTARPSSSAGATVLPSRSAAAPPTADNGVPGSLAPDSIAEVIEGPLRIRSKPSTADDSLKFPETLPTGASVYVIEGPVRGSDYAWYLVAPIDTRWQMGWVAAADHDGSPWLGAGALECPTEITLDVIANMSPVARLFCHGAREFEFHGTVQVPALGCGDPSPSWSPDWLNPVCSTYWLAEDPEDADVALAFYVPPNIPNPFQRAEDAQFVTAGIVVGMDHEAARDCTGSEQLFPGDDAYPDFPHPDTFVFYCRMALVASSLSVPGQ
jgi:hypothetical protein